MVNKALLFLSFVCLFPIIWQQPFKHKTEVFSKREMETVSISDCRCADSLVLTKIFRSTNGVVWKVPWDLKASMDTWNGVTLNDEDCVESLVLNDNALLGFLPPELGELNALKVLSLRDNQLQGSIPRFLGELNNLELLVLRNNEYSGRIPSVLGSLPKLQTLDLSGNLLFGNIPVELGELSNLTGLFLNENKLDGEMPIGLIKLDNLVYLNLSANNLIGEIPSGIGELSELMELALYENQLTGPLPISIGDLSLLTSLRLEKNQLTDSLPSNWGNLANLETFFLQNNDLKGCFPESYELFCDLNNNSTQENRGYNFFGNLALSWGGDLQKFCLGDLQMEADCDNDNTNLRNFNRNCTCPEREASQAFQVTIEEKATCKNENNGSIEGEISSIEEEFRVNWIGVAGSDEIITNQSFEIENLGIGEYEINIFFLSNDSLIYTNQISISEFNCSEITSIPQLITPNGDGLNDAFIIDALLDNPTFFKDNQLTIFNRWGDMVFHAQPYNNDWTGQQQNGQLLPEGTYYYLLKIDLNDGLIYKGDITVVRK